MEFQNAVSLLAPPAIRGKEVRLVTEPKNSRKTEKDHKGRIKCLIGGVRKILFILDTIKYCFELHLMNTDPPVSSSY